MMRSYGASAATSSERPGSPHSDTVESLDNPSGLNPMERNEGLCLPTREKSVRMDEFEAPLQRHSIRKRYRQTNVDDLGNDSEAEIGYSSYTDYLEAYRGKSPYLGGIRYMLNAAIPSPPYQFTILDLSNDKKSRALVLSRRDRKYDIGIVANLHQPPANVAVQILLWNTEYYLGEDEVNVLGLGLKLDPRFFGALHPAEPGQNRRHWDPKYVTIAGAVVTIVRHSNPNKVDAVPVVLIAGMEWESELVDAVEEEIGDTYPFQPSASETFPVYAPRGMTKRHEHENYFRLLNWCLKNEGESLAEPKDSLLKPLFPLIYLDLFRIRNFCEFLRQKHQRLLVSPYYATEAAKLEKIHSDMPDDRLRLRAMVENSEDGLTHLLRYIRSQKCADWPLSKSWVRVENDLRATHREARRLEAQLRDYLQIKVGEWALQESKKSIELSNQQIEEGKRVKIFTILAFIYVPLNLATSIFGMNLSELNGSGKKLWVFLATAIIALLIAGTAWFLLEEGNNFRRWQRRRIPDTRTRFTFGARLAMLAWLWRRGHTEWAWKSDAWWRILIDSPSKLFQPERARGLTACEYVSRYEEEFSLHSTFEPYGIDNVHEWY
ncbi:hypothetical protein BDR22DRAFT_192223 [Usnea florida]